MTRWVGPCCRDAQATHHDVRRVTLPRRDPLRMFVLEDLELRGSLPLSSPPAATRRLPTPSGTAELPSGARSIRSSPCRRQFHRRASGRSSASITTRRVDMSPGDISLEGTSLTAKDGRLISAGSYGCTFQRIYFDVSTADENALYARLAPGEYQCEDRGHSVGPVLVLPRTHRTAAIPGRIEGRTGGLVR